MYSVILQIQKNTEHYIQFNNVFKSHTTRHTICVFMESNIHVKLIAKRKKIGLQYNFSDYVVNLIFTITILYLMSFVPK